MVESHNRNHTMSWPGWYSCMCTDPLKDREYKHCQYTSLSYVTVLIEFIKPVVAPVVKGLYVLSMLFKEMIGFIKPVVHVVVKGLYMLFMLFKEMNGCRLPKEIYSCSGAWLKQLMPFIFFIPRLVVSAVSHVLSDVLWGCLHSWFYWHCVGIELTLHFLYFFFHQILMNLLLVTYFGCDFLLVGFCWNCIILNVYKLLVYFGFWAIRCFAGVLALVLYFVYTSISATFLGVTLMAAIYHIGACNVIAVVLFVYLMYAMKSVAVKFVASARQKVRSLGNITDGYLDNVQRAYATFIRVWRYSPKFDSAKAKKDEGIAATEAFATTMAHNKHRPARRSNINTLSWWVKFLLLIKLYHRWIVRDACIGQPIPSTQTNVAVYRVGGTAINVSVALGATFEDLQTTLQAKHSYAIKNQTLCVNGESLTLEEMAMPVSSLLDQRNVSHVVVHTDLLTAAGFYERCLLARQSTWLSTWFDLSLDETGIADAEWKRQLDHFMNGNESCRWSNQSVDLKNKVRFLAQCNNETTRRALTTWSFPTGTVKQKTFKPR